VSAPAGGPCWELLTAVQDALDCPPPADATGEQVFLRLRCERARLALAAIRAVLAHQESGPAEMTAAAHRLRDCLADHPADGYGHSPFSS
jgi:hypothetical protein